MTTWQYIVIFDIHDDTYSLARLRTEATAALDAMAQTDGAHLLGEPTWHIHGNRLVGTTEAEPVDLFEYHTTTDEPGPTVDDIAIYRATHGDTVNLTRPELDIVITRLTALGVSAAEIGRRLGTTGRAIVRARTRLGISVPTHTAKAS